MWIGRERKSDDLAGIAVKREGHGEERLQRITLRAAVQRDIDFAGAHAADQRMTHL
jgi:hypothetical protein